MLLSQGFDCDAKGISWVRLGLLLACSWPASMEVDDPSLVASAGLVPFWRQGIERGWEPWPASP